MTGWDEEWKALRETFVALSEKRFERMRELMALLAGPGATREALEELARNFHSLKGVGASYGFPGITSLGKFSQEECKAMLERGLLPGEEDLRRFSGRLADMEKELSAGGTTGPSEGPGACPP
jgi:chemotaxis protein histidine kinase CheA